MSANSEIRQDNAETLTNSKPEGEFVNLKKVKPHQPQPDWQSIWEPYIKALKDKEFKVETFYGRTWQCLHINIGDCCLRLRKIGELKIIFTNTLNPSTDTRKKFRKFCEKNEVNGKEYGEKDVKKTERTKRFFSVSDDADAVTKVTNFLIDFQVKWQEISPED